MLSMPQSFSHNAVFYILLWLIVINIISFITYRADKRRAIRGKWRIPERTLLLLALIGGSIGAFAGMLVFHHKTRHAVFLIGVPLILLLHFCILCLYLKYS